jgi:hypothetical protein
MAIFDLISTLRNRDQASGSVKQDGGSPIIADPTLG